MQQPETTLIYWAPSRVRFNLTLILALVVIVLGLLQAAGFDPLAAACSPRTSSESAATSEGTQAEGGDPAAESTNRGSAWLLVIVGIGVGAYSWLTSPRQYRVYSDALIIMFGTPRRRTIHFSDIREAVLDRGFMGDPLRVYTVNRRRIALQVREPEEMHRYLDGAVKDFWRANPQYAPQPDEEGEGGGAAADVVESTVADAGEPPDEPHAEGTQDDAAEDAPRRNPRPRRRSLRDDDTPDGSDDESPPRFT
jgi:hypothetical protein